MIEEFINNDNFDPENIGKINAKYTIIATGGNSYFKTKIG